MTSVARLIFEDGTEFIGSFFTTKTECMSEIVFNTAMSGYQEVLTDPSYTNQSVLMTYPMIGNYGINPNDMESDKSHLSALLCKEYVSLPSNWESVQPLHMYLNEHEIVGVEGLDTRSIALHIRRHGAQRVCITTNVSASIDQIQQQIHAFPLMKGSNLASVVSTPNTYTWQSPNTPPPSRRLAVLDCGVKHNILRHFHQRGCECVVLPLDRAQDALSAESFDGLFISNGPGDPEAVSVAIDVIRMNLGKIPIFGICLGHQLIALALGGNTYKLPFGHHGINHPVKNVSTGRVEITAQNHGFCVDIDSLGDAVVVTHINLYDGTNEGFRHVEYPLFSVQYHPEASPGPCDSDYLFDDFVTIMDRTCIVK